MSLVHFCVACLSGFVLLQLAWLPWLNRCIRIDPTCASVPRVAWRAALGYARNLFLVATLTSAAVLGLVAWLHAQAGAALPHVRAALATLQHWRDALAWVSPGWSAASRCGAERRPGYQCLSPG